MNETFAVPPRPPDYSDVYAGPIADPGMSAREILQTCLARAPHWFVALHRLRNLMVRPFGLKTGSGTHNGGSLALLENLPVVRESEAELASGISDRHLDFLVIVAKSGGTSPEVSITTQIWYNATCGADLPCAGPALSQGDHPALHS